MATIEIPLGDRVTLIDQEDRDLILPFSWRTCPTGHTVYVRADCLMHRLITGARPGEVVDHKNGDGLDNRRENLRICTSGENRMNMRKTRGASCFKGVSPIRYPGRPWSAAICFQGRHLFLGTYPTEVEAARAYNAAAIELFGDFARINVIEGLSYEEMVAAPERNRNPGFRTLKQAASQS